MENNYDANGGEFRQKSHKKLYIFLAVIGAIVFISIISSVFAVSGGGGDNSVNGGTTTTQANYRGLQLSNVKMTYEYSTYLGYTVKISGNAKNVSGRNRSYASVEFVVYDENGNNLGTAMDNINNLMAGDSWNFEATLLSFPSVKPASYKFIEVTAW